MPPHLDCAFASVPAPGTQLGYAENAVVFPVIDCQGDEAA
jgi:hypothetical protein